MDLKAVIFDMDGVLIDAREWHYEALNEALQLFGCFIDKEEHLARFDGLPTKVKLEMLASEGRLDSRLFGLVAEVKQERTMRIAAQRNRPNLEHLILIGNLRSRGIRVGVATNSIRLTSEYMLETAGLLSQLDVLITNQDVSQAKPNPQIYLKAISSLGVEAHQAIAVEDSDAGQAAAEGAGLPVLRVGSPSEVGVGLLERIMSPGTHNDPGRNGDE